MTAIRRLLLPFALLLLAAVFHPGTTLANPPCTLWTLQFGCVLYAPQLIPGARWCSSLDEAPGPHQIAFYTNADFNADHNWAYCMILDLLPGQPYQVLDLQEVNWDGPQFWIYSVRVGTLSAVSFHNWFDLMSDSRSYVFGQTVSNLDWSYTFGSFAASTLPDLVPILPPVSRYKPRF